MYDLLFQVSNSTNNQVERTFAEIMKCYRQRPLADNHVYRSVLIKQSTGDSKYSNLRLIIITFKSELSSFALLIFKCVLNTR